MSAAHGGEGGGCSQQPGYFLIHVVLLKVIGKIG